MPEPDNLIRIEISGWKTLKATARWFATLFGFFGFLAFMAGLLS